VNVDDLETDVPYPGQQTMECSLVFNDAMQDRVRFDIEVCPQGFQQTHGRYAV
jgi:hypothetical protein